MLLSRPAHAGSTACAAGGSIIIGLIRTVYLTDPVKRIYMVADGIDTPFGIGKAQPHRASSWWLPPE
jgi:hypothetical protein